MGVVNKDIVKLTFTKVPMLKPLVALIVGVILGHSYFIAGVNYFPHLIICSFLLLILSQFPLFVLYRKYIYTIVFYILLILAGVWLISRKTPTVNKKHFSNFNAIQVIGIVDDEPNFKEKTIRFPMRIIQVIDSNITYTVNGNVMITMLKDTINMANVMYGDILLFKNHIIETLPIVNPNEFDYKAYLANKEIWHQCFLTTADYKLLSTDGGYPILTFSLHLRKELIKKFRNYLQNDEAFQIAIALLFGYRYQIDANILDAFTSTGTIHILSVSGLHVSMVFALLTFVFVVFDRLKYGKIIRLVFIGIIIWGYVIFTGMSPPIVRAGIMISFYIIAILFRRQQIAINTLLASALFILLIAPTNLFDVGFQLSYSALLGILLLGPILRFLWLPRQKIWRYIIEYCYISIAAQLFTLPFVLYYFGKFPVYFLIANLFMVIPSTLIMYLGVTLAISPLPIFNLWLGKILDITISWTVTGLKYIASLPMAVYKGILWNGYQSIVLSIMLVFLLLTLNYTNKRMFFVWLILFFFLISSLSFHILVNDRYKGIRIYNVRKDIAIANINKGKVILFSNLDSLHHPTLQFSVLPDLENFANERNIIFVKLKNNERQNFYIKVGDKRILIVENKLDTLRIIPSDLILWRKNNGNSLRTIYNRFVPYKLIIDGSNSQKTIDRLSKEDVKSEAIYLLKNNFAYVWNEE